MKVHTFADWMIVHPKPYELSTDKEQNLLRLISWELYTLPYIFVESQSFNEQTVLEFCDQWKERNFSVRAFPKNNPLKRGARIALKKACDVQEAIREFMALDEDFIFLIAAYAERDFVGNIIVSDQDQVIVEILHSNHHSEVAQGLADIVLDYKKPQSIYTQIDLSRKVLYVSGVGWTGCIIHHPQTPQFVRQIAASGLNKIRLTRGRYIRGYYEFTYNNIDGLCFIDAIFEKYYISNWI